MSDSKPASEELSTARNVFGERRPVMAVAFTHHNSPENTDQNVPGIADSQDSLPVLQVMALLRLP